MTQHRYARVPCSTYPKLYNIYIYILIFEMRYENMINIEESDIEIM